MADGFGRRPSRSAGLTEQVEKNTGELASVAAEEPIGKDGMPQCRLRGHPKTCGATVRTITVVTEAFVEVGWRHIS